MKKILCWMIVLSGVSVLYGCGDAIEIPNVDPPSVSPDDTPDDGQPLSGDVVFTATAENRPDGSAVLWKKGERIALMAGAASQVLTNTAENGAVGRFPATLTGSETAFTALYPAMEGSTLNGATASITVPAAQTAGQAPDFRIAKSTGTLLYFRNLLSTISFTVGFEGATRVRIETTGGDAITGAATVDYSGESPIATATDRFVEITGNFVKGVTYSVAVVPGRIDGYTGTAWAGEEESAHFSGVGATLSAGSDTNIGVIGEDIPTFRITNLWVWGGTGPEYGGDKVIDILTTPNYFNQEDGRGVRAWADNYLEIRPDGTFMNWAGADGRNWWFVYSGAVNPAGGKDLDLTGFYDVIPRGSATWTSNGTSITFTRPDGSSSTGSLLLPGTYKTPSTNSSRTVTISEGHIALQFTITGGKDDWNNIYKDYDVIAAHPRVLYIEVEQMPSGFSTPQEARTTDTDFAYEAPAIPEPDFDWNTLPGTWKVNKFTVLGGSGNDPAWLAPVDKSWNFDSTLNKESDNELTITATGMTATQITGTINWTGGADGEFWNYKWMNTNAKYTDYYGTDLSRFYDKIPKGQSAFTLDMSSMSITLSNGETPVMLPPGDHNSFAYNKVLTVPDNCFAIVFHLQDPVSATSEQWNDIDRFLLAPLEYAIIFKKL